MAEPRSFRAGRRLGRTLIGAPFLALLLTVAALAFVILPTARLLG